MSASRFAALRAFLRHFREAMQRAEIGVWPITVRLDFERERPESPLKSGHIVVRRGE
jgi:hypothetical protein